MSITTYDITPPITAALAVWPGDTPPTREVLCDLARGDTITLSTLHATVHLGAHVDAPSHYAADGAAMHERALDYYVGPCQVVDAPVARGRRVRRADLQAEVTSERVLLRTRTFPDPTVFNQDFAGVDPLLIEHLAAQGVRLIGIDTPSVDLFSSKDLPAHHAVHRHDMAILEGVVLDTVAAGHYELIALPLKLVGFDASPVRAILRRVDGGR